MIVYLYFTLVLSDMQRKDKKYRIDVPQHVYLKGLDGQCIFYGMFDHLVFLTQYFCSAERMEIVTTAYSHMPNHFHSQNRAKSLQNLRSFILSLEPSYAKEYNSARGIKGGVFKEEFGSSPKATAKLAKTNICYINCNCTVGKLADNILSYRWNLLAYYDNDHPFSEKIVIRRASAKLKNSLAVVKYMRREVKPLSYNLLMDMFEDLDERESAQLTDFIVSKYNPLSYDAIIHYFGSLEKAKEAMVYNEGSEYDLKEDWEDYSNYEKMTAIYRELFPEHKICNVESLSTEEQELLLREISYRTGVSLKQIRKFLHLK